MVGVLGMNGQLVQHHVDQVTSVEADDVSIRMEMTRLTSVNAPAQLTTIEIKSSTSRHKYAIWDLALYGRSGQNGHDVLSRVVKLL